MNRIYYSPWRWVDGFVIAAKPSHLTQGATQGASRASRIGGAPPKKKTLITLELFFEPSHLTLPS